jgi:hypothetical protein
MTRHLTRRGPRRKARFCWTRFPTAAGEFVIYRLYRRDGANAVHMESVTVLGTDDRTYIAQRVMRARIQLRNRVDEMDLAAMEELERAA